MAISNLVLIGATGIRDALGRLPADATVDAAASRSFALAFEVNGPCFCCAKDDEKFHAAVGGLLLHYERDAAVRRRIEQEVKVLSALTSGRLADFDPEEFEPIGLAKHFAAAKAKK
jgi:hypothetical protein